MTIRKKWILTLGLIAVISIVVNSLVLSVLTSHNFTNYLEDDYEQTCKEIVTYLSKAMDEGDYLESQFSMELEAYLGNSITQIKVYDSSGKLIAEVNDDASMSSGPGMGMMRGMRNGMKSRYDIVDNFHINGTDGIIGEVNITRYSTSGNSYAAKMFQNSLFKNSLISVGIVIVLVFILGLFMSKKVSKELIQTADMAQNIDENKENLIRYSKTKEIRIIQQSLQSLSARLKLKQKARKTLVDEMIHQTRTPLTILKMHLEGIEDGVIDMKAEEIKVCENQIDNLSDIISNISSLIEAGSNENEIVLEEFELYQFIKQIVNGMRTQFQKKNIEFKLLTTEKITVKTDKYRLGQSIYNILTNAYKFTSNGGLVSLNYHRENSNILIEITDSGCGMNEEEQLKIFDAYYKKSKSEGAAGDGIGLYVVKENMKNIMGRIEVESKEGKGSKFILIFPLQSND